MTVPPAAAVMLAVAGYAAARLVLGHRRKLSGTRLIDGSHLVMGVAMAGMLAPGLMLPVPLIGWLAVFLVLTVAFLPGLVASVRAGRGAEAVRHGEHVLVGVAMLLMLVGMGHAEPVPASPASDRGAPLVEMASMHHGALPARPPVTAGGIQHSSGSVMLVTLSLVIAAYLLMTAVRRAIVVLASVRALAVEGSGDVGWFMAPVWTAACEPVMAVAMAVLLWAA